MDQPALAVEKLRERLARQRLRCIGSYGITTKASALKSASNANALFRPNLRMSVNEVQSVKL